jgi:RNA polymerase sigma-70 factor (ECF subfamily)
VGGVSTDVSDEHAEAFAQARPRLFGIAYRMLGSVAEADDVVQDAWLRWQSADRDEVRDPLAFLATTTTRLALNVAQSARVRREAYVGPWLPEPVDTSADPALGAERGAALEVAVLMLLEKLTPTERAAYVLHEAFDYPYREIAEVLDLGSEDNARQLASRARRKLAAARPATSVDDESRRRLLDAFVAAARDGELARLEELLAADVVNYADGGGVVHAARVPFRGRERVARALVGVVAKFWSDDATKQAVDVNGAPAILVRDAGGAPIAVLTVTAGDEGIEEILWQVNPEKLATVAKLPVTD